MWGLETIPAYIVREKGDRTSCQSITILTLSLFPLLSLLDHKVVFLKGKKACSGTVGIEHGTKTHWLSGSNETWNQYSANAVCQQMHCGKATQYNFIDSKMFKEGVWKESYSCLPNTKSLFECENRTLPSNHSDTIASVTCSGNVRQC